MSKKYIYICSNCGTKFLKWVGQCYECLSWQTLEEEIKTNNIITIDQKSECQLKTLSQYQDQKEDFRIKTNIDELNRVLGGGIVIGSVILIGGEPGIGKSTLLLQILDSIPHHLQSIYFSAEESIPQIINRSKRLKILNKNIKIASDNSIENLIDTIAKNRNVDLIIIDSIQTVRTNEVTSAPGTISQIKTITQILVQLAKKYNISIIIVGHITKDGYLAGPKILEHMVDTVLYFESDHKNSFLVLKSSKNRYGDINEVGLFEMTGIGLIQIKDPSKYLLDQYNSNTIGSTIFPNTEGKRTILIEIQSLLISSKMILPKRSVIGWEINRLSMLIAVLAVKTGINLMNYEIYITVSSNIKITNTEADLTVATSLLSSFFKKPLAGIFIGEIALSGEIRPVKYLMNRVQEAYKMGFMKIICRKDKNLHNKIQLLKNIEIVNIQNIKELVNYLKYKTYD